MRIKRGQAYTIRSAIHTAEKQIPGNDRSQLAEFERDLIATACCALWDVNIKKLVSCLSRLTNGSPERRDNWKSLLDLTLTTLQPRIV